jgi:flagellar hook assembly protein FlgD
MDDVIVNENSITAIAFALSQNYPNPFNPVTKIKYQIPNSSVVKLAIYDMLGKEMAVLVNKKQDKGNYEIEWDGTKYPSGVYFYKLSATGGARQFSATKKLVLLK